MQLTADVQRCVLEASRAGVWAASESAMHPSDAIRRELSTV
jgi:hypothetical protein